MRPAQQRKTARLCSAEILQQLSAGRTALKPIFASHIAKAQLSTKDRALAKELVYGVLRRKEELDTALTRLSRTPLHKIDPFLYQVLVIGLYQILFLQKIPDSAAVNEAVISCKTRKKKPVPPRLYGFVNGTLRQAVRSRQQLLHHLASRKEPTLNHPRWLTERWQHRFGKKETARICAINNRPPNLVLRINRRVTAKEPFCRQLDKAAIPWRPAQFAPDAVILPQGAEIDKIPGYREGAFQVQDQAAQLCTLLLAPFTAPELIALDACAGVGGKTSHLLQLVPPDTTIHAVEPEPFRFTRLQQMQQRDNAANLRIYQKSLYAFAPQCLFTRILIDAPCSGTGVLRRNPDIRWHRNVDDILSFQEKQLALLEAAASLAAPDAVIVYATCSIEEEENSQVIAKFLQTHPQFTLSDPRPFLPEPAHKFIDNNFFSPRPAEEIDGFFAARMQKSDGNEVQRLPR